MSLVEDLVLLFLFGIATLLLVYATVLPIFRSHRRASGLKVKYSRKQKRLRKV